MADSSQPVEESPYDIEPSAPPAVAPAEEPLPPQPASSTPTLNAAGKPYDPETGRLLPTKPKHSARMLRLAKEAGLDDAETAGMEPDELRSHVQEFQLEQLSESRRQSKEAVVSNAVNKTVANTPEPPPLDLPEDEWDERLVKTFKAMQSRIDQLEQRHQQLMQQEMVRVNETQTQTADRVFAEHPDIFGKGRVAKDSVEFKRRCKVWEEAASLKDGDWEAKVREAKSLFVTESKPAPKPVDDELQKRGREWDEAALARPTHRNGAAEPEGVEKATASVAAMLNENRKNGRAKPSVADEFPE